MNLITAALNSSPASRSVQTRSNAIPGSYSVAFKDTLAAASGNESNEAKVISEKYGLSVGVEAIAKNEKDIVGRGKSGNLQDVVIAPNILQQMKTDGALREKIYGYINYYTTEDKQAFEQLEQLGGVNIVGRSLIVHEDGTYTIWSAGVTSPEEVEKGKKIEAEKQKEKAQKARQVVEELQEADAVSSSYSMYPFQRVTTAPIYSPGVMSAQEWVQQYVPLKGRKFTDMI
ncbi:DUF6033 family protein [Paenibacillus sp. BAC0078]